MSASNYDRTWSEVDRILAPKDLALGSRSRWEVISQLAVWIHNNSLAVDNVLELHKAVGFDIDDEGTLDPDNDCCDYCSERDGEAVIYPCETVGALFKDFGDRDAR